MSIWKRSIASLVRKPVRSILLLLIVTLIGILILSALMIRTAANTQTEALNRELMTTFTLEKDKYNSDLFHVEGLYPGAMVPYYEGPEFSNELYDTVMSIDGVKTGNWEHWGGSYMETDLELFYGTDLEEYETGVLHNAAEELPNDWILRVMLTECSCPSERNSRLCEYFTSGRMELVEGRHIEETDSCVVLISEDLAEKNGLSLGDTIQIGVSRLSEEGPGDKELEAAMAHRFDDCVLGPFDMTIIGIYEIKVAPEIDGSIDATANQPENILIIDEQTGNQYWEHMLQSMLPRMTREEAETINNHFSQTMTFEIDDPSHMERIQKELYERMPETEGFLWVTNATAVEAASAPALWMMKLLRTVMIGIIAAGAVLLTLVMLFWTKARRQEAGTLLSYGIRKGSVLGQLLLEGLILVLIASIIAIFPAKIVSNKLQDSLANQAVSETQEEKEKLLRGSMDSVSDIYARRTYNKLRDFTPETVETSITAKEVAAMFVINLITVSAAVLISGIPIYLMKPKKILSEEK